MESQETPQTIIHNEDNVGLLELCLNLRISSQALMRSINSLSRSLKNSKKCLEEFDNVLESLNAGTPRPKL